MCFQVKVKQRYMCICVIGPGLSTAPTPIEPGLSTALELGLPTALELGLPTALGLPTDLTPIEQGLGGLPVLCIPIELVGKPTDQSSDEYSSGGTAGLAVDGNTNGDYTVGSCTHTSK